MAKHENQRPDCSGKILLANPALHDGVFDRSVILLAEHTNSEGAFGVILNRPLGKQRVADVLPDPKFAPLARLRVYFGGPVGQEHLTFAAFRWDQKKGLHYAVRISAEQAVDQSHQHGTLVRAFIGYSGWTKGQLERELREHTWFLARPTSQLLGNPHDRALWASTMRPISPYHRLLAEAPNNPFMN